MFHYLFGFRGRINRAKLWLFLLIVLAFDIAAGIAVISAIGVQNIMNVADGSAQPEVLFASGALPIVCAIVGVAFLALIVAAFAVAVKRLHDRNKSAWWLLIFYVLPLALNVPRQMAVWQAMRDGTLIHIMQHGGAMALGGPIATLLSGAASIISLWAFVELYCLRGTVGDNRYGPDPIAGRV